MSPNRVATLFTLFVILLGFGFRPSLGTAAARQAPADSLWALTLTTGPGWDSTKGPGAQRYFGDHSRNLGRLRQEGKLLMGGRFGGAGLLLLRAQSESEARGMFAPDSTIVTGVFAAKFEAWRTIFTGAVPPR